MSITDGKTAFVNAGSVSIGVSQMFSVTPGSSDPTYLVLTALDRNEYTLGAGGAPGSFSGGGRTVALGNIGGDGRGTGIVFTYQPLSGRYYSSSYGYLDQLTYHSSGRLGDTTNLSLFGTSNLTLAAFYATNAYDMEQIDAAGYLGSATVVTQPNFTTAVPSQATPNSIAAVADSFVGQAWNMNGCWVLASTIAAEAGTSLPVQSTMIGVAGQANGEWIVAYNGPAGQAGNWQSMVTAGEIVVIGTASGGGHITTCVSGSGSTAMLVDNITYESASGRVQNLANDGSSSDIIVAAPHAASLEWSGVQAATVVIYELDTPIVHTTVLTDTLACLATQSLASLFAVTDPGGKAITSWQVYDTATSDTLVLGGVAYGDHSAAAALTAASLASLFLVAGATATTDTLDVRAYNGSYWGDWQSLGVAITAPVPPVLAAQTANQIWTGGKPIALALPASTFRDPLGAALTYSAKLSSGQALPGWLNFNAATGTFSGTPPLTAQTLVIAVTATDSNGLSASETFSATVQETPVVTVQTPNQSWTQGKAITFALPATTFKDPQGQKLVYTAKLSSGQALPGWLSFNATTETFIGMAPLAAQTLGITVSATNSSGLSVSETFSATVLGAPVLTAQTPNQIWTEGKAVSLALPANTFTDPQGQKLTYTVSQTSGQPLPAWLGFNAATDTFTGVAPGIAQSLSIKVTAKDSSGLATSESFTVTVQPPVAAIIQAGIQAGIKVSTPTPNQTWAAGQHVDLVLPANTFTDALGLKMTFAAYQESGSNATSWLSFNPTTDELTGTVPTAATGTMALEVIATDAQHMTATDLFSVTFVPGVGHIAAAGIVASFGVSAPSVASQVVALLATHS
jgi:Putative Ig domain